MLPIKVPPLGESIVEATVSRWQKKEGDAVAAGDTLVELETDKITVEVPAPSAGVLSKQLKGEGDVVAVDETSHTNPTVLRLAPFFRSYARDSLVDLRNRRGLVAQRRLWIMRSWIGGWPTHL